ncbi:unnamed protein product [Rotaria magnacalcarata]|uniref:Reverse transcriptase domain-containing protein n=1 Tax=Rotaria magnacalcarata TaxID=392030 RepID=A0A8S2N7M6_9BILA|nr:unnamed protein product [Rotaria magnacalcarata]
MNEFIIRLRAIWVEQFPQETEADLVKHLFCKIRPDMLNVMGCPRNVSLQETLLESQRVEEILYHRMIENNQINQLFNNATYNNNSSLNGNDAASSRKDDHMRASSVKPTVPFRSPTNNEHEECELQPFIRKSKVYQVISQITKGVLSPAKNLCIQTANLSKTTITILVDQKLTTISRKNIKQLNAINHLAKTNVKEAPDTRDDNIINLSNTDISNDQKTQLQQLVKQYPDVFTNKSSRTSKREIIQDNINEILQEEIIALSNSPWASSVLLAAEKDGSLRFCIDYRALNAVTIRDAYPIPKIDDTLDALEEVKFISTIHLRSGYWQVQIDPKSQALTPFISHKGLYEFKVMPYGLMKAPATFQRLMDIVLAGLKWQCCLTYIEDVIIYSRIFDRHLDDLTQKLITSPIKNTPNFHHPFTLEVDACAYGLGAVLAQEYNGEKFVIAYASRTLPSAERNYSSTEREALAIVWATKLFRPYIERMEIFIRTDCQAFQWLKESKHVIERLARWAMHVAAFQIKKIKYRPGATNTNSDPLWRYPQEESS